MKTFSGAAGFALLLVLWTLVVLSTVALMFAASVGTEIRAGQESWNTLQAERLAKAGHELANYLESRSLGSSSEDFTGLPVETVVSGMTYRINFGIGTVDLVFDGENRSLDLTAAGEE